MSNLTLIWAMSQNRVIGLKNALPWRLPRDLAHFKALTLGHPVVMGRRTWESLGKPLAGRVNVVVTHNPSFESVHCRIAHSVAGGIALANETVVNGKHPFVIGGADLYRQTLPLATRLCITIVESWVPGDALFPEFDWGQWKETSRQWHPADEKNGYATSFLTLEKRSTRYPSG